RCMMLSFPGGEGKGRIPQPAFAPRCTPKTDGVYFTAPMFWVARFSNFVSDAFTSVSGRKKVWIVSFSGVVTAGGRFWSHQNWTVFALLNTPEAIVVRGEGALTPGTALMRPGSAAAASGLMAYVMKRTMAAFLLSPALVAAKPISVIPMTSVT